jgi:arabinoxylan arabinofuranohydrolase
MDSRWRRTTGNHCPTANTYIRVAGCVMGSPYSFTSAGDPLVTHISAADPDAHVWNNTVWVYCSVDANLRDYGLSSNDGWTYEYMDGYHAFSSTDLIHWIDHGEIFHSRNVGWGPKGWMWAPSVAWNFKSGRESQFFLYFPHRDWKGVWRIGVATSSSPTGPFSDTGAPIGGIAGIDPHVFVDDDGQAYIYYNSAMVAKLKNNWIELAEAPRSVEYGANAIESNFRFEEGSYLHKKDGIYYYSYSNWRALSTTAYYGMGTTPYGPFVWKGALAGRKSGSQDHHSIINFQGQWYYFFHRDTAWQEKSKLQWYGHRRIACYARMFYFANQTILQVNPTSFVINAAGSPYTATDGTAYQWDQWYNSGNSGKSSSPISGTSDDFLYQTHRYGRNFDYSIPLTNGVYRVTFKFAETHHNSPGKRKFHVDVEGARAISNLDVFAIVGKNRACDRIRKVSVADSELNIIFTSVTDNAMVSALKIELIKPLVD